MSKSSLEYTEMAGLAQAMIGLRCVPITKQDEELIAVTKWMSKRIDELAKK